MTIIIETPSEVTGIYKDGKKRKDCCLGAELIEFEVLKGEEAYCEDEEILMEFSNGKEMRIYIDTASGNLCVYTD